MPTKEGILREKTFKDDGLDVGRRVFYTITTDQKLRPDYSVKAVSLLIQALHQKGVLKDGDIGDILFDLVH